MAKSYMIYTLHIPDDTAEVGHHVSPFRFVVVQTHLGNDCISSPHLRMTKVAVRVVLVDHLSQLVDNDG